jgi:hypothetical protein
MNPSSPFVCDMTALSSEDRLRHRQLADFLLSMLQAIREIPDGYNFVFLFDQATYDALSQITLLEHACCPFFTIGTRLKPGRELIWQLTGTEGVKPFIQMEFAAWFRKMTIPGSRS